MNCPACGAPIQPGSRFCGVCGHRLETAAPVRPVSPVAGSPLPRPGPIAGPGGAPLGAPAGAGPAGKGRPPILPPGPVRGPVVLPPPGEGVDSYVGVTLNNRFRVDAKLGEGGFGAVYKGVQIATNRQVALKLLHPEMTRDENLVARFRREGLVLCNLTDAHTITTYDFDQTPDGTLYIAMELLQGRSLHEIFHEEAPIAWHRMFKIVSEMCSSLAEAHQTGIVHRDLKPENIYLEHRPGNPEFVKVLDFGIAKVMRGDGSVDPNAPQLTATGQTLGTLEYMSPEQLMGKQLDGRSDVYAIGVLAYEMITGRLPFPDAKGPAGLITAQLKQTPMPPSLANPSGGIPQGVDRVILRMLEKDKNNRFPDVSAVADAALECLRTGGVWGPAEPDPMPSSLVTTVPLRHAPGAPGPGPMAMSGGPGGDRRATPAPGQMQPMPMYQGGPPPSMQQGSAPGPYASMPMSMQGAPASTQAALQAARSPRTWIWLALGVIAVGVAVGAILAFAT